MKPSRDDKWEDLWTNDNSGADNNNSTNDATTTYSLYVSNLASSVTARDLKKLFEKIGSLVSANIILNPDNGESRGYGFVDFATDRERERARKELHNVSFMGTKIRVSRSSNKCTLYVGNLPQFMEDRDNAENYEEIKSKLEQISCIPIQRIRKRKGYNYGFVEYENHRQAQAALISLRNSSWDDCDLRVEIAENGLENEREHHPKVASLHKKNERGSMEKRKTLYIKNLSKSTSDFEFKSVFEKFGKLTRSLIIRDVPSRKLNYGFVQFESVEAAENAYDEVLTKVFFTFFFLEWILVRCHTCCVLGSWQ